MEFIASEVLQAEKQVVIPARTDYPDIRLDPKDPVRAGEKIELVLRRDGVETDILSYAQTRTIGVGNEVRIFAKLVVAEMVAFTAPMEKSRVTSNMGTVTEKEVEKIVE